ncbi:MAG: cyclodeaminase/cyclohydrolase family protein [Phycisphaeraceae bacterium]|nr:MAG: cyclodeaminase/cyclohydrolase family protein [Phycisphaeraceae bacterium]
MSASGGSDADSVFGTMSFHEWLGAVAAKSPTPGGGAVASAVGALSASLAGMVVAYSVGKKSLAAHQDALADAARTLERARALMLALADEDARAYGTVNTLSRLPEGDPGRAGLASAMEAAVRAPMATIAASVDLLRLMLRLAPITNTHLHSDLGIAADLALASARSSLWNVRVNAGALPGGAGDAAVREARAMIAAGEALHADVCRSCGGGTP